MRFRKGSRVEVLGFKEVPYGAWRSAEIVSGNGHTYGVRYYSFGLANNVAIEERVPRKVIRPCPPQIDVDRWEVGELVEVLDNVYWKTATVLEELSGRYYVVRLLGTAEMLTFHRVNLRTRHSWQDGKWFMTGKVSCSLKSSTLTGSDVNQNLKPLVKNIVPQETSVASLRMLKRHLPCDCIDEALEFVERMPMEPNADVWETLMNLARVHGDLELGDRCAEFVKELDPTRLNKQSREGFLPVKESDVEKESLKKRSGVNALSRRANATHEYKAGDANLPENDELYELLRNIKKHMVEMGYVAETKMCLHDIDPESKETALLGHSERIAFARAVLNSAPRRSFTILKNLRVCVDCHKAMQIMSEIVGRDFQMRDAKRFHLIKNGACNCNDYW